MKVKITGKFFCKFRCRTSKVFISSINLLKFDNFAVCIRLFSEFLNHSCVAMELVHIWHLVLRVSDCPPIPGKGCGAGGVASVQKRGLFLFLFVPPFPSFLFLPFFPLSFPPFVFLSYDICSCFVRGQHFLKVFPPSKHVGLKPVLSHSSLLAV